MIRNYIKIAWRNITRHKSHSIINISGLAIGIAACLMIFLVVNFELSFDRFQPNYKNIYRVVMENTHGDGVTYHPGVPAPMPEALKVDFPQAKFASLFSAYGSQITVVSNGDKPSASDPKYTEKTGVLFVEPGFFEMFSYKWLAGSYKSLGDPQMVVISQGEAKKYFGDWKNAMGRTLKMDNLISLKVAGVVEDAPFNSDFPLKVMVSYITLKNPTYRDAYMSGYGWGDNDSNHQVFVQLQPGTSVAQINRELLAFVAKHYNGKQAKEKRHYLEPLSKMHFDTQFGGSLGDHTTSMATIRTLILIGVLIILMASINFINLSTAQSVGRSKEVGIRKVLGSDRKQLVFQVLGETALLVLISIVIAFGIAQLGLPYLNKMASVPENISILNWQVIGFLLVLAIAVTLLSGIYPAMVVSGFKPVMALKNRITAASVGGIPLRRVLVVTQFAISQLLIIGTIVAVQQMNFINEADLGFNKNALMIIPSPSDSLNLTKQQTLKQQLLSIAGVKSVTFMSDQPSSENNWSANFYFDHSEKELDHETYIKIGDADYFKTFGLRFVAGHGYIATDTAHSVVVNQTFIGKLGIHDPQAAIGKTVRLGGHGPWYPISGVVQDFKTNSLREAVKPIIIFGQKKQEGIVGIKLATEHLHNTVDQVQRLWQQTYPEYAYTGYFLDENIAEFYQQENQLAMIYKAFALVAIFISCLGLYGLISYMVLQKTKEVGVRKVLGASIGNIVFLFSKEFMLLIGLSCLIAVPAAWYMMSNWLQNFAYRISLTPAVFVMAILISFVVASMAVGYKSVRAALASPVKSLKNE